MTVVVQGFGPFRTHKVNPSEVLVRELAQQDRDGVVTEVLPTSRERVLAAVPELVARHRPSVWLGVGLAASRATLTVEAVAINLADWGPDAADVDGAHVVREPVIAGGPAAHLTNLPVGEILDAWHAAGLPGHLSLSADSYVCNLSFYVAAQTVVDLGLSCRVGFVHVPLMPEMVKSPAQPSMARSLQREGLDLALSASQSAARDANLYRENARDVN
jgi:pyroglutamyl-peptidase